MSSVTVVSVTSKEANVTSKSGQCTSKQSMSPVRAVIVASKQSLSLIKAVGVTRQAVKAASKSVSSINLHRHQIAVSAISKQTGQ